MTISKAILPAAGLGTRFLPATKSTPKEMLPIVDKPMIQYAIEEASKSGISDFIIITGKNKRAIEDHFDVAYELEEELRQKHKDKLIGEINSLIDLNFAFVRQGKPLGLGHAILCSQSFVGNEAFAVMLSDDVVSPDEKLLTDLIDAYKEHNASIIALQEVPIENVSQYGVISGLEIDKGVFKIDSLVEKPQIEDAPSNLAIIGRYILTPDIFTILMKTTAGKGGEIQLTDALNELARNRDVFGVLFKGKRYDAGSKIGFIEANIDFALNRKEFSGPIYEYLKSIVNSN